MLFSKLKELILKIFDFSDPLICLCKIYLNKTDNVQTLKIASVPLFCSGIVHIIYLSR